MKHFATQLIFFFITLLVAYPMMIVCWSMLAKEQDGKPNLIFAPAVYGHTFSRLQEADRMGKVDILFLGSSHAYRGFNTSWFAEKGYKVFNLGSSSQTHLQTTVLLHRYLDKLKPGIIVYEVYPPVFSLDGSESAIDIHSNTRPDVTGLAEVILTGNSTAINSYLYSWYYFKTAFPDTLREPRRMVDDLYRNGGFVEKDFRTFRNITHRDTIIEMRFLQKAAFSFNLKTIRNSGIPVLLVQAPVTKGLYRSYKNTGRIDQWLSGKGEYINFNLQMNLDDSLHYYDPHHLNTDGVKLFNERVLKEIELRNKAGDRTTN